MRRVCRSALLAFIAACLTMLAGCGLLPGRTESEGSVSPTATATVPAQTPAGPTLPPGLVELMRLEADIDGDGKEDAIVLAAEGEGFGEVRIGVLGANGYIHTAVGEGEFVDAHMAATPGGAPCALVSIDLASTDYVTAVFAFGGGKPIPKGEIAAYVSKAKGASVLVEDHTEAIGSWYYAQDFALTDGFALEPASAMRIELQPRGALHTIAEVPVELLVDGAYTAGTAPADSLIYPVETDGETYLSFTLEDGGKGRILFTRDADYATYINGVPEESYFDNIEYWG